MSRVQDLLHGVFRHVSYLIGLGYLQSSWLDRWLNIPFIPVSSGESCSLREIKVMEYVQLQAVLHPPVKLSTTIKIHHYCGCLSLPDTFFSIWFQNDIA